ncbi:MAG: FapA family protein, partial [Halanaerobium sp.]
GDVDLEEGNIDFVGSVKISGDLREGFIVKASGDVEVGGNVAAAEIESGGSVLIKKGFLGRNKGKITAKGDVNARFVENAEIKANNVRVHEAIMHSQVTAKDSIIVSGGKGLIVGGRLMAQNIIEANMIGSRLATKTYVEIGLEPELRKKFKAAKDELENVEDNLDKVNKGVALLRSMKEKGIKLPPNKKEMFSKLKSTKNELETKKLELEAEIKELEEQLTASDEAVIKVNKCIFPGVQLLSSKDKMIIRNRISKCAFTEVNKELRQKTNV